MPEELGEGLYLAATGMGLVFLTLIVFLFILLALRSLFPGEEVVEETDAGEPAAPALAVETSGQVVGQEAQPAPQAQSPPGIAAEGGRISGARIAAMAVAMYLQMERSEVPQDNSTAPAAPLLSQGPSSWTAQGRANLWQSQGSRPQAYGQRAHSAYPPRDGVNR